MPGVPLQQFGFRRRELLIFQGGVRLCRGWGLVALVAGRIQSSKDSPQRPWGEPRLIGSEVDPVDPERLPHVCGGEPILEGLVTTVSSWALTPPGTIHLAPMGPRILDDPGHSDWKRFLLRPFQTAQTFHNLQEHGEGVLHVTDDVLLLAQSAVGSVEPLPPLRPAGQVRGWVLQDCCRFYEFRIVAHDTSKDRAELLAEVVAWGRVRDFFGFNRAKHAVLEAAILATRLHLLPREEIEAEYRKLAVLVDKTGGPRERQAFAWLADRVRLAWDQPGGHVGGGTPPPTVNLP